MDARVADMRRAQAGLPGSSRVKRVMVVCVIAGRCCVRGLPEARCPDG
jgi:hypothetical protein